MELEGGCDKDVEKEETDLALAGDTKIKTVQKLSRNFSCWSKTFQTIWKFSRLFGNFSSYAISSRSDAGLTKVILSLGWCLNKLVSVELISAMEIYGDTLCSCFVKQIFYFIQILKEQVEKKIDS